jgi:hypothetical protein
MDQYEAAAKADRLIELLITHQPALFGATNALSQSGAAQSIAEVLSSLRHELTQRLAGQPG